MISCYLCFLEESLHLLALDVAETEFVIQFAPTQVSCFE